jgi:hypothetical protein
MAYDGRKRNPWQCRRLDFSPKLSRKVKVFAKKSLLLSHFLGIFQKYFCSRGITKTTNFISTLPENVTDFYTCIRKLLAEYMDWHKGPCRQTIVKRQKQHLQILGGGGGNNWQRSASFSIQPPPALIGYKFGQAALSEKVALRIFLNSRTNSGWMYVYIGVNVFKSDKAAGV